VKIKYNLNNLGNIRHI